MIADISNGISLTNDGPWNTTVYLVTINQCIWKLELEVEEVVDPGMTQEMKGLVEKVTSKYWVTYCFTKILVVDVGGSLQKWKCKFCVKTYKILGTTPTNLTIHVTGTSSFINGI
jgi:hypothetical protein